VLFGRASALTFGSDPFGPSGRASVTSGCPTRRKTSTKVDTSEDRIAEHRTIRAPRTMAMIAILAVFVLAITWFADRDDPSAAPGSGVDASSVVLEDGQHFVLVSSTTATVMTVDPAEVLGGAEAVEAARTDGAIGPGEELANPFYLRNPTRETRRLPLAAGFEARLIDASTIQLGPSLDGDELAALFSGGASPEAYYGFAPGELPMMITVVQGAVTQAEQHYLP
jgi:hypothetical protein